MASSFLASSRAAPPTHSEAEVKYEEEHSEKQVDEHFPELEMPAY